jgi:hypothetical protein
MWVSGHRHEAAVIYPRECTTGTVEEQAGWASKLVWAQRVEKKSFASAGYRTPVVQSVVRHYTE